jgi:alcohol dehydrogenase (cytochrome c)
MFIATPQNQAIALDAKTGDQIWRYRREIPEDLSQLHPTSRGVGLWQDKLSRKDLTARRLDRRGGGARRL